MPHENNKKQTSPIVVTAAAIGVGAIAAIGSYFLGKQHGAEAAAASSPQRTSSSSTSHRPPSTSTTPRHQPVSRPADRDDDDLSNEKPGYQQNHECGICFRDFDQVRDNNEEIHTTPCGHIYCSYCLNRALERHHSCPFCRATVEPGQTLRIFL